MREVRCCFRRYQSINQSIDQIGQYISGELSSGSVKPLPVIRKIFIMENGASASAERALSLNYQNSGEDEIDVGKFSIAHCCRWYVLCMAK